MSSDVDITSLDWDTILDYNLANAFAIPQDEVEDDTLSKYKTSSTTSYSESTGLLDDMLENLQTIQTNLQYMLNYAVDGIDATSDEKRETAYAQLRSLSSGVDSIVRDYKLEDLTLFTGRSFELSYGSATTLNMTLDNLASSFDPDEYDESDDDAGLKLATADEGAFVTISYDYLNTIRNESSDIIGLDITDSYTCKGDEAVQQLTDGEYQVEVSYAGAKSVVYIENLDGTAIDSQVVDLSGNGQVDVNFKCGVGLSFEKTSWALSSDDVDKYDYETYGPESLYANLTYESNVQHNLDDGTGNTAVESDASVISGRWLFGSTGTMNVEASVAAVNDGMTGMSTGQYNLKIQYDGDSGDRSSLWLYDPNGTLISTVRGVDLSQDGTVSVDMGTGIAFSLETKDFTSSDRTYNTYIDYTAEEEAYEIFDFDSYYDVIASALDLVNENISTVETAQEELSSRYSIVQSAIKLAATAGANMSSGLLNVLGGSGLDADSLFSTLSSSASGTATVASADGDIFSALNDTITSLSESEDYDVLALYYK